MSDEVEIDVGDLIAVSAFDAATGKLPPVYWLTRRRTAGELSGLIEVWAVKPERERYDNGDVDWLPPKETVDVDDTWIGEWTVAEAWVRVGAGVPATDIECLRVGQPPLMT